MTAHLNEQRGRKQLILNSSPCGPLMDIAMDIPWALPERTPNTTNPHGQHRRLLQAKTISTKLEDDWDIYCIHVLQSLDCTIWYTTVCLQILAHNFWANSSKLFITLLCCTSNSVIWLLDEQRGVNVKQEPNSATAPLQGWATAWLGCLRADDYMWQQHLGQSFDWDDIIKVCPLSNPLWQITFNRP